MKTIGEILSHNLRLRREALHLTQADVAERAGISLGAYQRIEYGTNWLTRETATKLAAALETTEAALFQAPDLAPPQATPLEAWVIIGQALLASHGIPAPNGTDEDLQAALSTLEEIAASILSKGRKSPKRA